MNDNELNELEWARRTAHETLQRAVQRDPMAALHGMMDHMNRLQSKKGFHRDAGAVRRWEALFIHITAAFVILKFVDAEFAQRLEVFATYQATAEDYLAVTRTLLHTWEEKPPRSNSLTDAQKIEIVERLIDYAAKQGINFDAAANMGFDGYKRSQLYEFKKVWKSR